MKYLWWLVCALAAMGNGDPVAGQKLYRTGVTAGGSPVRGTLQGDISFEDAAFNCAGCHRISGFGSSEGAAYTPPLSAETLFRERDLHRGELFRKLFQEVQPAWFMARISALNVRPAYTDETLAAALRQGHDPTGKPFNSVMPRYQLSDQDMANLIAYLKTLSSSMPEGVSDNEIHFATVVAGKVNPEKKAAMLDVMQAYVHRKNTDTRYLQQRPGFSYMYKDDLVESWRIWRLHVWELDGSPETWEDQLVALYRQQPVFAILSGMAEGHWRPIHRFCEQNRIPGLFPNTDLPVVDQVGIYPLYLSEGLALEARVLGVWLREDHAGEVIQVVRDQDRSRFPAGVLAKTMPVREHLLQDRASPAFWQDLLEREQPENLVLWLNIEDLEHLVQAPGLEQVRYIYLSPTMIPDRTTLDPRLSQKLRLVWPYTMPDRVQPRTYRVRSWLRSRSIAKRHERIQLNTFFALTMADHALVHQVRRFSREYFIESIEHEAENGLEPGVYPHSSLGPGQRFAAKGGVIVALTGSGVKAISRRIIP